MTYKDFSFHNALHISLFNFEKLFGIYFSNKWQIRPRQSIQPIHMYPCIGLKSLFKPQFSFLIIMICRTQMYFCDITFRTNLYVCFFYFYIYTLGSKNLKILQLSFNVLFLDHITWLSLLMSKIGLSGNVKEEGETSDGN